MFNSTGDDPPIANTAVRDTLSWILGVIPTHEMIDQYLIDGRCIKCPVLSEIREQ